MVWFDYFKYFKQNYHKISTKNLKTLITHFQELVEERERKDREFDATVDDEDLDFSQEVMS